VSSTPAAALSKTPFNEIHRRHKAKMVDFGGWDMPVEYSGLIAEHMAVRTAVGLFDVSHMGEIHFRGPGSLDAVQYISMNDASKLAVGQAHYSALLTEQGTFVDDILVHKLGENDYLLVVNASTKDKDYAWIRQHCAQFKGHISDFSPHYSQLAIQGPRALETMQKLTNADIASLKNYRFMWGNVAGYPDVLIARTGYTGEDGFEIYFSSDLAVGEKMWNAILEAGADYGILPCGLGARNTLRLEAGMSLYGHEITDTINVFEANLERFLKLDKGVDFVGRAALAAAKDKPLSRKLVGLEMVDRGIGRDGYRLFGAADGAEPIGVVTSGSPAPFLKKNIALAYVPPSFTELGTEIYVEIRGQKVKAKVVAVPFYKRAKK
jgi:aminomethyltransferase